MKNKLPPYVYLNRGRLRFQRRQRGGGWQLHVFECQDAASPEFHREYARVLAGRTEVPAGKTFANLIAHYKRGERYAALAPRSKADYDKHLGWLESKIGTRDPRAMERRHINDMRDGTMAPSAFNYRLAVLRVLFEHAIDIGWRKDNPAKGVRKRSVEGIDRQPWPQDKIDAFRATATGRTRLLFEMLIGTGQRVADVLRMQWGHVEGQGIWVRQGKTAKRLFVPFTPRLAQALSDAPRDGLLILQSRNGPWRYRGAADAVMAVRRAIGAEAHDIHALRYSAASELLLAGCDDEQIAAITGQTQAMVQHYTRSTRQRVRAVEAQGKRG